MGTSKNKFFDSSKTESFGSFRTKSSDSHRKLKNFRDARNPQESEILDGSQSSKTLKSEEFRHAQKSDNKKISDNNKKDKKSEKFEELVKKYDIDIEKLKKEQEKLAKTLSIKDSMDFSNITKTGAIENTFFENKIISGVVVLSNEEIIEQEYFSDKVKFPYLPGFRAYRELPAMIEAFTKLEEKPELVLIHGHGIAQDRLGLASHFSLSTGIPTIGIAENLLSGEVKGNNIVKDGKIVGKVIQLKEGSNPLYVSPGNLISVETSAELIKNLVKEGHKLPEVMRKAKKYVRETREELFG